MKKLLLLPGFLLLFAIRLVAQTQIGTSPIYHNGTLVGVGTTNFGEKLNVGGNIQVEFGHSIGITQTNDKFTYNSFNVGHYSLGWYTNYTTPPKSYYSAFGGISLFTSGANRLAILQNGNIGIGTETPENSEGWTKVLDVYGNTDSKILTTTSAIRTGIWSHNLGFYGAPAGGIIGTQTNHSFSIITGGTTKMVVATNGNVGIGTTDPGGFKLAVEGKIGAREINVLATNPWPDFVFESTYQLPSLAEVESFIKINKHLPGVASTKEVEKEGLDLGKMDAILLKNVEELTLHLIQKDKEIKEQNKIIESLIKRLDAMEKGK